MATITRIIVTSGPAKKKPKAGDTRYLKGRGVWQVRRQVRHGSAYVVRNGKPVWEWVDQDPQPTGGEHGQG